MKLLIIEDEPSLLELMTQVLRKEGYVVEEARTCAEAGYKLSVYRYDCILLDIMLPDGSGLELLELLRQEDKRERAIIISARDSVEDKVLGLELGADDYLPKPFHLAELSARVRSVIRRSCGGGPQGIVLGNVRLYAGSRRVEVGDRELALLKKEFDILSYFMQRPDHMVDKAILAEAVWGDYADQSNSFDFIYSQMKNLRRKLKESGADIKIQSVYGFGYRLVSES